MTFVTLIENPVRNMLARPLYIALACFAAFIPNSVCAAPVNLVLKDVAVNLKRQESINPRSDFEVVAEHLPPDYVPRRGERGPRNPSRVVDADGNYTKKRLDHLIKSAQLIGINGTELTVQLRLFGRGTHTITVKHNLKGPKVFERDARFGPGQGVVHQITFRVPRLEGSIYIDSGNQKRLKIVGGDLDYGRPGFRVERRRNTNRVLILPVENKGSRSISRCAATAILTDHNGVDRNHGTAIGRLRAGATTNVEFRYQFQRSGIRGHNKFVATISCPSGTELITVNNGARGRLR